MEDKEKRLGKKLEDINADDWRVWVYCFAWFAIFLLLFVTVSTHLNNNKLCAKRIYYNDSCSYNEFNKLCTCGNVVFEGKDEVAEIITSGALKEATTLKQMPKIKFIPINN